MSNEEWEQICSDTTSQMLEFIKPFVTPISYALNENEGEHLGSGSYFSLNDNKYIITNEHVAKKLNTHQLTHQFYGNDDIFRWINPAVAHLPPIDIAISKINDKTWNYKQHNSKAIPECLFDKTHSPVEGELFFMAGYSGERSRFCFDTLCSKCTPYLTQKLPSPEEINEMNPHYHFSLHYNTEEAKSLDGKNHLPDPHGFSGMLIWDTKRVKCLQTGEKWNPELARVTGIAWGWPSSSACILATKIEHFDLASLILKINQEAIKTYQKSTLDNP